MMFMWPCGCEIHKKTFVAFASRLIQYNALANIWFEGRLERETAVFTLLPFSIILISKIY